MSERENWCCQGAEECDGLRWNPEKNCIEFLLYESHSGHVWAKANACPICSARLPAEPLKDERRHRYAWRVANGRPTLRVLGFAHAEELVAFAVDCESGVVSMTVQGAFRCAVEVGGTGARECVEAAERWAITEELIVGPADKSALGAA